MQPSLELLGWQIKVPPLINIQGHFKDSCCSSFAKTKIIELQMAYTFCRSKIQLHTRMPMPPYGATWANVKSFKNTVKIFKVCSRNEEQLWCANLATVNSNISEITGQILHLHQIIDWKWYRRRLNDGIMDRTALIPLDVWNHEESGKTLD